MRRGLTTTAMLWLGAICAAGSVMAGRAAAQDSPMAVLCSGYAQQWARVERSGDPDVLRRAIRQISPSCASVLANARARLAQVERQRQAAKQAADERAAEQQAAANQQALENAQAQAAAAENARLQAQAAQAQAEREAQAQAERDAQARAAEAQAAQARAQQEAQEQANARAAADDQAYSIAQSANSLAGYVAYLSTYPAGRHAGDAQINRNNLTPYSITFCNQTGKKIYVGEIYQPIGETNQFRYLGWFTFNSGECKYMFDTMNTHFYLYANSDDGTTWGKDIDECIVEHDAFDFMLDRQAKTCPSNAKVVKVYAYTAGQKQFTVTFTP